MAVKKRKITILLVLMAILLKGHVAAQSYSVLNNKNLQIEARVHYGFFYQHHFEMERYNAHFPSYELSLYSATFGKQYWQTLYNYPLIGFTFYHSDLGGFEDLGQVYALYPFINFPINSSESSQLTFKMGVGLSYLTNKFDNTYNYHNFAIGSHVNSAINLSFEYRQQIVPRLYLNTSIGLTHFSNGSTRTPNYGINIFSAATGLSFYLKRPNPLLANKLNPKLYLFEFDNKKWLSVDFNMAMGVKDLTQEIDYGTHNYHSVFDFNANVLADVSVKGRVGIGLELVKDNSDYDFLKQKEITNMNNALSVNPDTNYVMHEYSNFEVLKPGIGPSYEMVLDRMSFLFHLGWHLAGADLHEGSFYQKLALRYEVFDNIYLTFGLTTHYARADYLGLGIGYRLKYKYYLNKR